MKTRYLGICLAQIALGAIQASAGTTGSLSGTVGPDQFNQVDVYAANGDLAASVTPLQAYQVGNLPPGDYYVVASALFSDNIPELYPDVPCPLFLCREDFANGTLVAVAAGLDTPGINFELIRGASLRVFVATEGAGDLIPGARVHLYDGSGSEIAAGDSGEVEFRGMTPGTYFVSAEDPTGAHRSELFNNHPCDGCQAITGSPILLEQAVTRSAMIHLLDASLGFYTLPPCRLVDTRNSTPLVSTEAFRVFDDFSACAVPPSAVSLVVNVTAVNPSANGELLLRANGWDLLHGSLELLPLVSFRAGQTRGVSTHLSIARGPGTSLQGSGFLAAALIPESGSVHLVVDVAGYYAPLP